MTTRQLILSSTSPGRRALLSRLPIPFTACAPDVDETPLENESAEQLVARLAKLKAMANAKDFPDAIIIGADQVGTLDGMLLNKPLEHDAAVQQLSLVSGKTVRFYTGIFLYDTRTQTFEKSVETYDVTFRELNREMIENYLRLEEALNCAGSFHVEGLGIALIKKLSGDDYTSLIGLPLIRLTDMLRKMGVEVIEGS